MAKLPGAIAGARIVGEKFVHAQRQQNPEGRMPLMDHIRELRNRVVKIALALGAGMVVGFIFFTPVWKVIDRPLCSAVIRGHTGCNTLGVNQLALDGPLDRVLPARQGRADRRGHLVLAVVALPAVGVRGARPVQPGEAVELHLPRLLPSRCSCIGVTLCYLVAGPVDALPARPDPGRRANLIQVDQYMSFVMAMLLAFGLAFELPLLIVMLNLAGILTHERFRKWRRVMIFGVFLIAGMANPSPDPITMLILGGGCAVLVEVAEFIVWSNDRRRARLRPDPYTDLADDQLSPLPSGSPGKD